MSNMSSSEKPSKILISACILGQKVRYDGKDSLVSSNAIEGWLNAGRLMPLCPEMAGGLPCPRPGCEITGSHGGRGVLEGTAVALTNVIPAKAGIQVDIDAYERIDIPSKNKSCIIYF